MVDTPTNDSPDPRIRFADRPPILFFDGECVMCNGCVDFVLSVEGGGTIQFAPIQGETAENLLDDRPETRGEWSIVLLDESGVHEASEAVLRLFTHLGGAWRLLSFFRVLPVSFRDAVYRVIAQNRYRLFGRKSSCRVPTPDEEDRFLP